MDKLTIGDCIKLHCKYNIVVVLKAGKVVGMELDFEGLISFKNYFI